MNDQLEKAFFVNVNSFFKNSFGKDRVDRIALFIACAGGIFWVWLLTVKYSFFGYYDWDLSLYSHALWCLSHGTTYSSLYGASFLADHAFYIAYILAPFYKIFHHPLFLVDLKIISLFAGSLLLYYIAARKTSPIVGLIFQISYILFPANIFMLLFEFNFESLAIGLIFTAFLLMEDNRKIPFFITIFFLCLIKENVPLIVFMFGAYGLFTKKQDRLFWGVMPMIMGIVTFWLAVFVITPFFRANLASGNSHIYFYLYSSLGNGPAGILETLVRDPGKILSSLSTKENIRYYLDLLGAHLPFALLNPLILMMGLPILLQTALSTAWTHHTIFFHYTATVAPFIFLASAGTFGILRNRRRPWFFALFFTFFILLSVLHFLKFLPAVERRIALWPSQNDRYRELIVQKLPIDATVETTFDMLNHEINRKNIFALFHVWMGVNPFNGERPYSRTREAQYASVDLQDPWLIADLRNDPLTTGRNLKEYFLDDPWEVLVRKDDLLLLKRSSPESRQMPVKIQGVSFVDNVIPLKMSSDAEISLEGLYIVPPPPGADDLSLTFFWKKTRPGNKLYSLVIRIESNGHELLRKDHFIGYTFYPTVLWENTQFIKEQYSCALPDLPPGEYSINFSIIDDLQQEAVKISDRLSFKGGSFRIVK